MEDVHSYSYGRLRYRRKVNAKRRQKFNDQWLDFQMNPQFQGWLEKMDDKPDSGYCSYCDTEIIAHKSALNQHSMTPKHRNNKERIAAEQVAIQTAVSCMAPTHIADNLECSMDDYSHTDQYVNEENGQVMNHRPEIANVVSVSTNNGEDHNDSSSRPPRLASTAGVPSLPHAQLDSHTDFSFDNHSDQPLNRFPAKDVAERVRLKAETLKLKAEREKLLSEAIYWRWKTEKIKEQVEILKMEKLKMRRELGLPSIIPTSTIDSNL